MEPVSRAVSHELNNPPMHHLCSDRAAAAPGRGDEPHGIVRRDDEIRPRSDFDDGALCAIGRREQ